MSNSRLTSELNRYFELDPSLKDNLPFLKNYIALKHKEILKETLEEYTRSDDFIRIYPSKGCDIYNKYFISKRNSNVFIYKALFTEELLPLDQHDNSHMMSSTATEEKESGKKFPISHKISYRQACKG